MLDQCLRRCPSIKKTLIYRLAFVAAAPPINRNPDGPSAVSCHIISDYYTLEYHYLAGNAGI